MQGRHTYIPRSLAPPQSVPLPPPNWFVISGVLAAELEDMQAAAQAKAVPVFMGYNKNVTRYVQQALDFAGTPAAEGALLTFIHNNAYKVVHN